MFQGFHHPREDTENCQSSGSPKPQTLGSPLAGAWGSDDSMVISPTSNLHHSSCNFCVVKMNKKKHGLKEQRISKRECLKIIPADAYRLSDCQTGLHLWSSFSLHHSPSQTPSPSRTWPTLEVSSTESMKSMDSIWNYMEQKKAPLPGTDDDVGIIADSAYSHMIS